MWSYEVFVGLQWPEHSAENNLLQNGELGQVLFIILTSLTLLLSPKTQGGKYKYVTNDPFLWE